ncbi:MFS family permease [Virgibacillus halotolerans]|uniref:MFS transporter n=1 Tax=Virgibacillus halotolerans TaxID=1071053 RepID=UPI00196210B3|nr:MFS transporter [Virgibacillus halotolerans]MBM7598837.1 MFS family permease [Virgibacillus halotolerans]
MKEKKLEKIWTKSFISISLTQFLVFTVFYTLLTTLPIYVMKHLGGSQSEAGLVVTVMLIAAIIIRPFSAKILDILGKKKGLVISVALFAATSVIYIWIDQFSSLLVVRFIHGLSFGLISTATGAIAADVIPESRRGAGMGYFAMAMNLAVVAGPFIGLSLLQFVSFQALFIVLFTFMIVGVLCSMIVRVPAHLEAAKQNDVVSFKLKWSDLIETKALPVAAISGLVGFAYASILSFISVYADSIGLSSTASYFFLVFAVVMLVFRPSLGRAFDNRGAKFVLIPSLFIFAIGLAFLSFTNTALMLLIAAGLIGLGYGTLLPGFQTMAIQTTDSTRSGHAISTFFIFYDTGIAAGAFIWGLIVANFGFKNMYLIGALLVIVTMLIFNMYLTRKEKPKYVKRPAIYNEEATSSK